MKLVYLTRIYKPHLLNVEPRFYALSRDFYKKLHFLKWNKVYAYMFGQKIFSFTLAEISRPLFLRPLHFLLNVEPHKTTIYI